MRRLISTLVLVASTAGLAHGAERATFILTSGERRSGSIAYHGDQHENLINGYLNLSQDNAKDLTFPLDQVAVIDFAGGTPSNDELAQLGTGQMLVTRAGARQQGRLLNMVGGDTLFWENESRQRQQYGIRDISRVYLNPQIARTVFNYVPTPAAPTRAAAGQDQGQPATGNRGTRRTGRASVIPNNQPGGARQRADAVQDDRWNQDARMQPITVRIDPRQDWTDTGLSVSRGDRFVFETSAQAPGLVGRIDNGPTFDIGNNQQPVSMRASGRLVIGLASEDRRGSRASVSVRISEP